MDVFHRLVARLVLAILILSPAWGCGGSAGDAATVEAGTRGPEFTRNAVVVGLSQFAFDASVAYDDFQDFAVNLRGITMMHLAIHDALNSIGPSYERYAYTGPVQPLAHPTAAAAQAAHDVLVNIY